MFQFPKPVNLLQRLIVRFAIWLSTYVIRTPELGVQVETLYKMECIGPDGNVKWTDYFHNRVVTAGLNKLLDATLKTGLTTPLWYLGLIGAIASDGAITTATAVLTSASNPFAAGDVGRAIIVKGAGAAGADLSTTILTFTNAGNVTLNANAGTTVAGAKFAFEPRAADTMAAHSFIESTTYSNASRPTWTPGAIAAGSVDNSGAVAAFNINGTDDIFGAFMCDNNTKGGATGTLYGGNVNSGGSSRHVLTGDTINVTATPTVTAV